MELVINEENLRNQEIQEFNSKVRALLVDENNNILVANYGGVYLLPGGSIDEGEDIYNAITRELNEELGQKYDKDELELICTLLYYQKNYPKRNDTYRNRLIQTYYFVGKSKGVLETKQKLTEKELKDNFKLESIPLEELERIILENKSNNPRNIYFKKELLAILKQYKNDINVKKLKLNNI